MPLRNTTTLSSSCFRRKTSELNALSASTALKLCFPFWMIVACSLQQVGEHGIQKNVHWVSCLFGIANLWISKVLRASWFVPFLVTSEQTILFTWVCLVFFGNCELTECKDIVIEVWIFFWCSPFLWLKFTKGRMERISQISLHCSCRRQARIRLQITGRHGRAFRWSNCRSNGWICKQEDWQQGLALYLSFSFLWFLLSATLLIDLQKQFSVPVPLSVTITWYLGVALLLVAVVGLGQRFLKEYKNPMLWFAVCVVPIQFFLCCNAWRLLNWEKGNLWNIYGRNRLQCNP